MRIWSVHPKYLDTKGLVALWRETLLAKKVLENKTNGYMNHPQLIRFRNSEHPLDSISYYLKNIYAEALSRNFEFDEKKIGTINYIEKIPVTKGQIIFETNHLLSKLERRDYEKFAYLSGIKEPDLNLIFYLIEGRVENWEKNSGLNDLQSIFAKTK
jgi:hypothetical protein